MGGNIVKRLNVAMAKYLSQNFCHAAGCILPVYADNEPRCDSARNAQNDASQELVMAIAREGVVL
jgi:hypothetical protein